MHDPAWFGNRYDPAMDHDGRLRVQLSDPQKYGFKYSPATEEQLLATEEALGFPLPPVLRALYAQVANGGFGFGDGMRGAIWGDSTNRALAASSITPSPSPRQERPCLV